MRSKDAGVIVHKRVQHTLPISMKFKGVVNLNILNNFILYNRRTVLVSEIFTKTLVNFSSRI